MTGNIMKSELLESERLNRKRMSKGTPLANGTTHLVHTEDEESMVRQATLAAAFHDHISCAKPPDFCKIQEGRDERAALPCETDHIYANSSETKGTTRDESQQLQQLKEMVLLQLELIQHQQEQLLKKDRQLQVVNQEKDALKTRLERMERRVALMKQRQEERSDDESAHETNQSSLSGSNLSRSNSSLSTSGNREKCISPFLASGLKRAETRESQQQRAVVRSIKRRYASQSRTAAKRHFASSLSTARSSSSQPKEKSSRSRSSSPASSNASLPNRRTSSVWSQVESRRSKGSQICSRSKSTNLRKQTDNILRTDKLYYTPVGESLKALEVPVKESLIEVPSWRYHPVTSCYQLEGTENIDDEVFAKRHFKLEVDERRRKRWDIQRIREQRLNEKLRRGRKGDKDQDNRGGRRWNGDIRSFYPDPKGVHFVEIANTVPVVAFGNPIPKFQPCEFSLPWFDAAAREKRESQQKSGKQRSYSGTRRGT